MSPMYVVELVGGVNDGRIAEVSGDVIASRCMLLPVAEETRLDFAGVTDEVVTFTRERWEWDGTFSRSGAFRFRRAAA